ncbi:hypothetical protein BDY24DRAFT_412633 [Mrakia frigida]|uniref:DUF1996 domain-containing protein n=1 Tax=Mrakia frigida TaxID=29902 RepID=UPI003FCC0ABC
MDDITVQGSSDIKQLTFGRIDPIVAPGIVSNHTHAIVGGSAYGVSTTWELAVEAECTTMPVQKDKSNYWLAPIYYIWENGSLSAVPISTTNITYLLRPPANDTVKEFPRDFSMLAGNSKRTTSDPTQASKMDAWVWFECQPSDGSTIVKSYGFPNRACSSVKAVLNFPWCWNGKDLSPHGPEGPTTNAHVGYGRGFGDADWVECANPDYPVRLPRITMEVTFDLTSFPYRNGSLSLSFGDTVGYGLHGDFLNGWPVNYLRDVFDVRAQCRAQQIGGTGNENCTVALADFDATAARNCIVRNAEVPNEHVGLDVPILIFPGCHNVQAGPLIPACTNTTYLSSDHPNMTHTDNYWGPDHIPFIAASTAAVVVKKKTYVGAIVGGILGGLAMIFTFLLVLFFRRRRQHRRQGELLSDIHPKDQTPPDFSNEGPLPPPKHYEPSVVGSYELSPSGMSATPPTSENRSFYGGFVDASNNNNSRVEELDTLHPLTIPTSSTVPRPSSDHSASPACSSPAPSSVQSYAQRSTPATPVGWRGKSMAERRRESTTTITSEGGGSSGEHGGQVREMRTVTGRKPDCFSAVCYFL